jgi:SAM-dependent methyltransferase
VYSTDLAYIHAVGFGGFAVAVAPEIARILRKAGIDRGRVVEFGCGSGTVARHLHGLGYEVSAFDVSPAMIRLARKSAPGVTFGVASLSSARLPSCDALIGVGEVVTYLPRGLATLRRFFAKAHAALLPGGVLIFDFIESARRRTYDTKTLKGSGWTIAVRATFDPRRRVLTRSMTMTRRTTRGQRRSREIHRVRIYDRHAIRRLLEQNGFVVSTSHSYGRHRLLPGNVAVIARKRGRYNRVP